MVTTKKSVSAIAAGATLIVIACMVMLRPDHRTAPASTSPDAKQLPDRSSVEYRSAPTPSEADTLDAAGEEAEPKPEESPTIHGRVLDNTTGLPLRADVTFSWFRSDTSNRVVTRCNDNGEFDIGRRIHESYRNCQITAAVPGYTSRTIEAGGCSLIKLDPDPSGILIRVGIAGANCFPRFVQLVWEGNEYRRGAFGEFDEATGEALIFVESQHFGDGNAADCHLSTDWFGEVLLGDVFTVVPGEQYEVTLQPPPGVSIQCRVVGPDGRRVPGALVRQTDYVQHMSAITNADGEASFVGIPEGKHLGISLAQAPGLLVCTPDLSVVASDGASPLVFDLSRCGVTDVHFGSGRVSSGWLIINRTDASFDPMSVWLPQDGVRISGLPPGRYQAFVSRRSEGVTEASITEDFEVLPLPQTSAWTFEWRRN